MVLTEKDITRYQKIYKKLFGKEISKEEASRQGLSLVLFIKAILNEN
jgi:hypothetical protein